MPLPSRVLLIDDDDLVAVALYEHLIANSVAVDLATDPIRAEALMRTNVYALIVIDAYLTGLLNARASELLAKVQLLCPSTPIVLLSAYGSETMAVHSVTFLSKPQSVVYLGEVIDGFLQNGTLPEPMVKH